jgi:hypothetical protein
MDDCDRMDAAVTRIGCQLQYVLHSLKDQTERKDNLLGELARNCVVINRQDRSPIARP